MRAVSRSATYYIGFQSINRSQTAIVTCVKRYLFVWTVFIIVLCDRGNDLSKYFYFGYQKYKKKKKRFINVIFTIILTRPLFFPTKIYIYISPRKKNGKLFWPKRSGFTHTYWNVESFRLEFLNGAYGNPVLRTSADIPRSRLSFLFPACRSITVDCLRTFKTRKTLGHT